MMANDSVVSRRLYRCVLALIFVAFSSQIAFAQTTPSGKEAVLAKCVLKAMDEKPDINFRGFETEIAMVQELLHEISSVMGTEGLGGSYRLISVPCQFHGNAEVRGWQKQEVEGEAAPAGNYVFFNPRWVQQVTDDFDRVQLIVLFGHEYAHFSELHVDMQLRGALDTAPRNLERRADFVSGCVVAKLGGTFPPVERFIHRIRTDQGTSRYHNSDVSEKAARDGFVACGGHFRPSYLYLILIAFIMSFLVLVGLAILTRSKLQLKLFRSSKKL